MYKVAFITSAQADSLRGLQWQPDSYFGPVCIPDGSCYISIEEVEGNTNPDVAWVNDLELSDYTPEQ